MSTRVIKIVLSLSLLAIGLALIVTRLTPARGYEISIYSGTPLFVWVALIGSDVTGISIIVHQAFTPGKGHWWAGGFCLILLSSFIILALPALRGYYYYNGADPFMHIEFATYIQSSAHFWSADLYPTTHILMAELSDICQVGLIVPARYLPPLISVLGMVFTYLLAQLIMPHRGQALLVAAASATILFSSAPSLYPQVTALLTLPLVFYLYFRIQQKPSAPLEIPFFLFLVLYPFLYPPVALALVFFLIAAEIARAILVARSSRIPYATALKDFSINPILISGIAFFSWVSSSVLFGNTLQNLVNFIQGMLPRAPQIAVAEASLQGLGIIGMTGYILKMYGDVLIAGILSLIAIVFIVRKVIARDNTFSGLLSLALILAVAGPLHFFC